MTQVLSGVIHGRTVMLDFDPGFADGESVEVVVRPAVESAAGLLAGFPDELDQQLDDILRERKRSSLRDSQP
jgi:hypothetical protein